MELLLIFAIILAIKLPLLCSGLYLYRIIHDVPEPEIDRDGGDFVRAGYDQGPRHRGPHGDLPAHSAAVRRGNKGHLEDAVAERKHTGHTAD